LPLPPPADAALLAAAFSAYLVRHPDESEIVGWFDTLLRDPEDPFVRARLAGHFTASAWLVDASGRRLLMTHHRKLGLWLQLGGHADGDRDLARVALREAEEESGLAGLTVEPEIFDLDRHWIPEHKGVPGHWHYDVRYVVRTGASEAFAMSEESIALAWRPIAAILDDPGYDASLQRMARKWIARGDG
jgi:8-oxo-dGTP pyrophosphatase MutT (NUDIX family)